MNWLRFNPTTESLTKPDIWTLLGFLKADMLQISAGGARPYVDEAAKRGVKCVLTMVRPPTDVNNLPGEWRSVDAFVNHLKQYNVAQYDRHPGIAGFSLAREPCGSNSFDSRNPPQNIRNLIAVCKAGYDYMKSQVPGIPVFSNLNTAGAHAYDSNFQFNNPDLYRVYMEDIRPAWIRLWMDQMDVLAYQYYNHGMSYQGTAISFMSHPDWFRAAVSNMLNLLLEEAHGKEVWMTEFGCPNKPHLTYDFTKEVPFTQNDQAEYMRIYGEEMQARNILSFWFKTLNIPGDEKYSFGLFDHVTYNNMNIPSLAANKAFEYLSIEDSPQPPPPPQEYYCNICDRYFSSRDEYERHLREAHPSGYDYTNAHGLVFLGTPLKYISKWAFRVRDKFIGEKIHNILHPVI